MMILSSVYSWTEVTLWAHRLKNQATTPQSDVLRATEVTLWAHRLKNQATTPQSDPDQRPSPQTPQHRGIHGLSADL
ncbi:hypothetical protein ES703_29949 [subsurface metagenome]